MGEKWVTQANRHDPLPHMPPSQPFSPADPPAWVNLGKTGRAKLEPIHRIVKNNHCFKPHFGVVCYSAKTNWNSVPLKFRAMEWCILVWHTFLEHFRGCHTAINENDVLQILLSLPWTPPENKGWFQGSFYPRNSIGRAFTLLDWQCLRSGKILFRYFQRKLTIQINKYLAECLQM